MRISWSAAEAKVKAAAIGSYLGSLGLLAIVEELNGNQELLSFLPVWVEVPLVALLPSLVTFLTGWKAEHTPRPPFRGGKTPVIPE